MKAATAANLASPAAAGLGPAQGNLNQAMRLFGRAEGIAYLSEAEISLQGDAPILEMLKQLASMKLPDTVAAVSVTAIAENLFAVPADYR